jgi:putative addiction module antidote
MVTLKLLAVGTNTGLILPPELLAQLGLKEGDEIVAELSGGGVLLSAGSPEVRRQLQLGEEFMDEYSDTFHELAK